MLRHFKKLSVDENGAVTVDWVVLVAATVALGFVVVTAITPGLTEKTAYIEGKIEE